MASLPHHRGSGGYGYGFYLLLFLVAILSQPTWSQSTPQDPDYTCAADRPCAVGCCGKFGICGMGPDFCAPENCVNSCDAKSECDPAGWGPQYAKSEGCPLNVCCSKFGFCGTSTEFCGNEVIQNPSCPGGTSASKRTVGYYESWAGGRPCDAVEPETIHFAAYTHINFAFASVDPTTFTVVPSDPGDLDLYSRLTALKAYAPGLQVWLSIGGWTMNDPDQPTATTFSDVAGSPDAQAAFANSLIRIMSTYGFDGVDIDWEYPVAPERSGRPEDYANYPNWLTNLRGAFAAAGHNYGLSITLPSSFWYLQNFDIVKLEKVVDWFNMMEYDLHGTWDSTDVWIGAFVNAHTNLTEIDQSLKLMWRNNIDPSKVVMGLGFYGRSFALSDPSCTAPGCPFSGAAPAGPCTGSPGTLSFAEIETLIGQGATVTLDTEAAVKIVTWDGNWVSYDDATTLQAKIDYANDNCLGGTMVWAASLDDSVGTASNALGQAGGLGTTGTPKANILLAAAGPLTACAWSSCVKPGETACPAGQTAAYQTTEGCPVDGNGVQLQGTGIAVQTNSQRSFCCPFDQAPTCSLQLPATSNCGAASCDVGTVSILSIPNWAGYCPTASASVCCTSPQVISPRALGCQWTECGSTSCPAGSSALVSVRTAQDGTPACSLSARKTLCCPSPLAYDPRTCSWEADQSVRLLCRTGCPQGKVAVADDVLEAGCVIGSSSYCCDPPSNVNSANQEGIDAFTRYVTQYMLGDRCNPGGSTTSSRKKKRAPGDLNVSVGGMASLLTVPEYAWEFEPGSSPDLQYIAPYRTEWNSLRTFLNPSLPSWDDMGDAVLRRGPSATNVQGIISAMLCPTVTTSTIDPLVCDLTTCSSGLCPRDRGPTPGDIADENFDTTRATAGQDFTNPDPLDFLGLDWWHAATALDWWNGSNHGVRGGTTVASSFFVDFATNPGQNLFTGAGPVWGCTTVAVVSDRGAWTAHFWQGFFNNAPTSDGFFLDVLSFIDLGDFIEYDGLNALSAPNGPFDPDTAQFVQVIIMTPEAFTLQQATPWTRPQLVPGTGPLYPNHIPAIENQLRASLRNQNVPISTYNYASDQAIWVWNPVLSSPTNVHWPWGLDREIHFLDEPWTGMMTVQRRATNVAGLAPAVRVWVEDVVVFTHSW